MLRLKDLLYPMHARWGMNAPRLLTTALLRFAMDVGTLAICLGEVLPAALSPSSRSISRVPGFLIGRLLAAFTLMLPLLSWCGAAGATTITINPATVTDCAEQFETVANSLQPGDELVLRGGIYSQQCARVITVFGTASQPIIIRAADGEAPILTRPMNANFDFPQNNIDIQNSSYLVIRGLVFQGGDIGVRFTGTNNNMVFEDNEVFDTGNVALALNSGNSDRMIIRRNHIHHTGRYTLGPTEGEGMYLGCNNDSCRVTNSVIEGNYIHHTRGTSEGGNDGIEVKDGSGGNIVRNNVIHDTNIGSSFPCIFVYGEGANPNIVEANVMWNCGEAIQVVADALVTNNIILTSGVGITAAPHAQVATMKNVTISHNTIYGHTDACLFVRWSGATNMVLANNAIYCPGKTAVNAAGLGGQIITRNYVEGAMVGASIDSSAFFNGGSAANAFVDPASRNLWPKTASVLVGNANATYASSRDFNTYPRVSSPFDVGAYESNGAAANPGWSVTTAFKPEFMKVLADRLSAGAWAELATSNLTATIGNTGGTIDNIFAYSDEGKWFGEAREFFYKGGDHNAAERFVSYYASPNTWQLEPHPPWMPTGVTQNHSYNYQAIDDAKDVFYYVNERYQLATKMWFSAIASTGVPAAQRGGMAQEYFPGVGLIRVQEGEVYRYREATNDWVQVAAGLAFGGPNGCCHVMAKYNAVHNILIFGGGDGVRQLYKMTADQTITALPLAPCDEMAIATTILTYDPVSGNFLVICKNFTFHEFNVPANSWAQLPSAGVPLFSDSFHSDNAATAVIASPVKSYGVLMFARYNSKFQGQHVLYKHAVASTGTVPSAPTELRVVRQ